MQFKTIARCFLALSVLTPTLVLAEAPEKDPSTEQRWSGLYGGLNVGMVKYTLNITDVQATSFNATLKESLNPTVTGGLQVGARHQASAQGNINGVYGFEFSVNFMDAEFTKNYGSPFALYEFTAENHLHNIYLIQYITGLAIDKVYLFLTAGLSWSSITADMTTLDSFPYFTSFQSDKTVFGTILGAGTEYAWNDKTSVRLKVDVVTPNVYSITDSLSNEFQLSNNIVQATIGFNYKLS